jgi:hypoxanthine phosphoribosyltransferase
MQEDLERVLFDETKIQARIEELAAAITAEYEGRELTVVAVLNGSLIFAADLLRRIPLPLKLDCLRAASYHGGTMSAGEVVFKQLVLPDVAGRHILIVDDILDSGITLAAIREKLQAARPLSVKICVLLRKLKARMQPVEADHVGFNIGDEFVVGYGLDYMERYRNIPCIGVLRKEMITAGPLAKAAGKTSGKSVA